MTDYLTRKHHSVFSAEDGVKAIDLFKSQKFDLAFIDIRMPNIDGMQLLSRIKKISPQTDVVILTGFGTMEMAISAFKMGIIDFLKKPITFEDLDVILNCLIEKKFNRSIRSNPSDDENKTVFIGVSSAIDLVRQHIDRLTSSQCNTIMIHGETGTGKEIVARIIHQQTSDDTPFIAVSCPALPDTLIESEFFGHVRGAFTGATMDRKGFFELSNGGTLYLDEVADLSWLGQAKLLRVLENRKFRRVGCSKEISVNTRIIAASNKSLEKCIHNGTFRPDLFYRLSIHTIYIPPLRERPNDILPLAEYFLSLSSTREKKTITSFSPGAQDKLRTYNYPGNVRELRNIIERSVIHCSTSRIKKRDILFSNDVIEEDISNLFEENKPERDLLLTALKKNRWNRSKTANYLDIPYSTLRYKIKKYNLKK